MEDKYRKVSEETGIPIEVVKEAYLSFWGHIKDRIEKLPLQEELSEEEFSSLQTNFNIPSLGKLTCDYKRYVGVKKKYNILKNLKK